MEDILFRLDKGILFEADMKMDSADQIKEALLGNFVFFLLLRYTINTFFMDALIEVSNRGMPRGVSGNPLKFQPAS